MSILKWLLSHFPAETQPKPVPGDSERLIARLQTENDALRRQESMNMANRDEINRLYRELNELRESKPATLARLTYDELIDEAKRRRLQDQARTSRPAQLQSQVASFQQRLSSPSRSSRRTSYPSHSDSPSMLPTYAALAAMHASNTAAAAPSSTDCHSSSSSSYSDSGSSSSSDSGSSSCDSSGGF